MKVLVDHDKCEGEGLCADLCPVNVFKVEIVSRQPRKAKTVVANDDACIFCRICEVNCPNQAIIIVQEGL
ncbi:MAG: ferredoxin family protein [Candidatus Bathyarchaeia archaeon]